MMISDILCDNIETVLDTLEVDLKRGSKYYYGKCPIHKSNNSHSLMIYPDGHTHRGFWQCLTKGCHNYFKPTIIGFIRGVLSNKEFGWQCKKDKYISFNNTIEFICKNFKIDYNNIKIDYEYIEKKKFLAQTNWSSPMVKNKPLMHRNEVKSKLNKLPTYFIKRGFSKEILEKYDVGYCGDSKKPMYQRCIVPIYDEGYNYLVGCQGRSIFDKCNKCGEYHDPFSAKCAEFPKWKVSEHFNKKDHLYNYWLAKSHIKMLRTAILVESCTNVWRLEESGVHNSVALFGGQLSDGQEFLLEKLGILNLVIIMDGDEAGLNHEKKIIEQTKNFYNIKTIHIDSGDIADMSVEKVHKHIIPFLEKIDGK